MTLKIVTANRIGDGVVIFLAEGERWTEIVHESLVAEGEEEEAALMAVAEKFDRDAVVIQPYLIDVTRAGDEVRPTRYRERIRAFGPSIHPDFVKTPAPDHFAADDNKA
ncbi:MAG: DUF2849 domain-containing protein [Rhodospirillales bacterium]